MPMLPFGPLTLPPFAPTMWDPWTNLLQPTAMIRIARRQGLRQWATREAQREEK
jgi:hypothetical protein